jgi:hypothetical protein
VPNQPKGIKPKITEHKIRSGVKWEGRIKQKVIKQTGIKQGLRVHMAQEGLTVHYNTLYFTQ